MVIHFEPLFTKSEFFKSYACSRQLSAEGANFRVARYSGVTVTSLQADLRGPMSACTQNRAAGID